MHGCVASQHNGSDDSLEQLLSDYEAIAFSSERASFLTRDLMRWCEPIGLYVPPEISTDMSRTVRRNIDWISRIEGIDTEPADTKSLADLVLELPADPATRDKIVDRMFPNDSRTRRQLKRTNCFFSYRTDSRNCITAGTVVIPSYLTRDQQDHCVAEELTQVLGLPNDGAEDRNSIFRSDSLVTSVSRRDQILLQLHYHSSLQPGMNRDEAIRRARPIAKDLLNSLDGTAD